MKQRKAIDLIFTVQRVCFLFEEIARKTSYGIVAISNSNEQFVIFLFALETLKHVL